MKVQHFKEESKLRAVDLDDLWIIKSLLEKDDQVFGVSYRRLKDESKTRADKSELIRVYLGVKLESSEFHRHAEMLRLTGPLIHSSDPNVALGSYHTLEVGVGDTITVKKKWRKWQLERLKEAEKAASAGIVLIVSVEEGEADFAILRRYGIDHAFRITKTISGKREAESYAATSKDFYEDVSGKIDDLKKKEEVSAVIVCGPGFAKEKIMERLKNRGVGNVYLESAGCAGRPGIQEVLKKGAVEKIVEDSRVALETRLVEEVFSRIGKNGPAAYGKEEVEHSVNLGAIETLLITYGYLQKYSPDELIESVKRQRGEVMVISPEHEAGERLDSIGGVAAILRFPIK